MLGKRYKRNKETVLFVAAHSSTCVSDLKSINKEVNEIEQILSEMREQLVTEKQNLDRGQVMSFHSDF